MLTKASVNEMTGSCTCVHNMRCSFLERPECKLKFPHRDLLVFSLGSIVCFAVEL
uniref:Uncharacterized protein n=1 Tax=Globisporangium ultimum (strain ATCC 200006 / CBS 805.95 / DAOM BR144) TaxID=431595 RepID=K3WTH4_GLOUD